MMEYYCLEVLLDSTALMSAITITPHRFSLVTYLNLGREGKEKENN
jgi:hypothetical protein